MALRVGKEDKRKTYIAAGLGIVVLILALRIFFQFFGGSSPAPVSAPVAVAPATAPIAVTPGATSTPYAHEAIKVPAGSGLDPTLHPEVMAQAENTQYSGNGRNIFSPNSAPTQVSQIEKPKQFRPEPTGPPPPPPLPAIDLKFYGYAASQGGPKQIFLLHGDDIFIAREGDVVDRRYRVVSIRPFSVEVEDIPYHNTQSLPLTQN